MTIKRTSAFSGLLAVLAALPLAGAAAPLRERGLVESDDPRIEKVPGIFSNRQYRWTTPASGGWAPAFLSGRRDLCSGGTLVSSGYGYGQEFPTNLARRPSLQFSFTAARSVSVLLLMHEEGQTARALLRGPGFERATNFETYAPSVLQYANGGVVGQVREFLIANTLDPSAEYSLELANLGFTPRSASNARLWMTANPELARGRGPQLLVDAFRLGSSAFCALEGQVRFPEKGGVPQARLTLDSGEAFFTDGFGRFSISGLHAGSHAITVDAFPGGAQEYRLFLPEGSALSNDFELPYPLAILKPRTGVPALVDALGTLAVEVEGPDEADDFQVRLVNREKSIPLPMVTRPVFGQSAVLHETRAGWALQLPLRKIRPAVPADTWDLEVACTVGGEKKVLRQPRAVKVLPRLDEPFYFVHVGELRTGTPQADRIAEEILELASLAGGRAMILGGGLMRWAGLRQENENLARILAGPEQVLMALPGESDITPWTNAALWSHAQSHEQWLRHVGPWFFDLRMQGVYFLFHDAQADPSRVTQALWKKTQRDARDDLRLVFSHRDAWKPQSNDAPPRPSLFVSSASPVDGLKQEAPYPVLNTGSPAVAFPARVRLLRFYTEIDNRWHLGPYAYRETEKDPPFFWRDPALLPPDGVSIATRRGPDDDAFPRWTARRNADAREVPSVPLLHFAGGPDDAWEHRLTRHYVLPNDGSQTSNTVVFTNQLGENFEDARARFVLARGNYHLEGPAVCLAAYDSDDLTRTVFHVRVKVIRHGVTAVAVRPM